MTTQELIQKLSVDFEDNQSIDLVIIPGKTFQVYPRSTNFLGETILFVAGNGNHKQLIVVTTSGNDPLPQQFTGERFENTHLEQGASVKLCPLNHENAAVIRELFDFARPVLIGVQNSFGLGDRLGIANPAHLRAIMKTKMKPVLAQQSIRELQRTRRRPEAVMDAATWAVLQEGYRDGFGADADHLKTSDDIDLMVQAGFTMFTIDPGDYVVNDADTLPLSEVAARIEALPWQTLEDMLGDLLARYPEGALKIAHDLKIEVNSEAVRRGILKYAGVIAHTVKMYRYFKQRYPDYPAEFELSVDETDSVTSPFEHFLVANELKRLGVPLVSLAPRFVGEFEKGIDYKGDLAAFRQEYVKHLKIAEMLGPYKISIHSGSDKFSVYEVIGSLNQGHVHVKTAGTSYLEALRTVAQVSPDLFREILDFACGLYETEKQSYHVSAELENVPDASTCSNPQLLDLFEQDDARQVLHVTYGKVLTSEESDGRYRFRDRIMDCLKANEAVHYEFLVKHFHRHLNSFL